MSLHPTTRRLMAPDIMALKRLRPIIALTSYQGGHMEFFKYMIDMLRERGCGHIKIFGGGGGVILPEEMEESSFDVFLAILEV